MRLFITLLIAFFSPLSTASVPPMDAVLIYNRIIHHNNIINAPNLHIAHTKESNAVYRPSVNVIYITTGLLEELKSKDEIAMILGHELAHAVLRHKADNIFTEYEADRQGAVYIQRMYNKCKGLQAIKRWDMPLSFSHPSGRSRYKALGCK